MAAHTVTPGYALASASFRSASRFSASLSSAATMSFPFSRPNIGHICGRCSNIPCEILLVGSTFFTKRCKGRHEANEHCKGRHRISCDRCSVRITEDHYHCFLCEAGDFDICSVCRANGESCMESSHKLVKRCFENGIIREVDEDSSIPYHPGMTEGLLMRAVRPYRLHDSYEDLEVSAGAGCHSCSTIISRLERLIEGEFDHKMAIFIENRPLKPHLETDWVNEAVRLMLVDPDLDYGADVGLPTTVVALRAERHPGDPIWNTDKDIAVAYLAFEFCNEDRKYQSRFVEMGLENKLQQLSPIVEAGDNLKVVGSWLHACQKAQSRCSTIPRDTLKPTRLLEVSEAGSRHPRLRLVQGDLIEGDTVDYVTLSYCWGLTGQQHPWILTKERLPSFFKEITLDQLPHTIADAVKVVHTNSIRYLWVDSICIIQDDAEDWEREAYRMGSVYSNSLFTIIGGSDSATGGLFFPRDQLKVSAAKFESTLKSDSGTTTCNVTIYPYLDDITHPKVATSKRAWCYQEELLSARRLYFSKDQFRWECLCSEHREAGRYSPGDSPSRSYSEPPYDSKVLFSDSRVVGEWYSIVAQYTSRSITYHGDIFAALAGVAATYKMTRNPQKRSKYLAGIWDNDVLNGILWHRVGSSLTRPTEYQTPSWSWLSVKGHVVFSRGYNTEGSTDAEYLECSVHTLNGDEFGTTAPGGSLKLRARLLSCEISVIADDRDFAKINNVVQNLPVRQKRMSGEKRTTTVSGSAEPEEHGLISEEKEHGTESSEKGGEYVDDEDEFISNKSVDTANIDTHPSRDISDYVLCNGPWEVGSKSPISPPGNRLDMAARVKLVDGAEFATVFFDGIEEAKTEQFFVAYISATQRPEGVLDRNGVALVCVEQGRYRRIGFVAFWDKLLSGKGDLTFLDEAEKAEIILV